MGTPEIVLMLALVVGGLGFRLWLRGARRRSSQPPSRGLATPAFAWQAALIILPVATLAGFGLFSIRQDRALAGEQARQSAVSLAALGARDLGRQLQAELSGYYNARFTLKAEQQSSLGHGGWAAGTGLASVRQQLTDWQQRHPDVPLTAQPDGEFAVTRDGRLPSAFAGPAVGRPPAWLV